MLKRKIFADRVKAGALLAERLAGLTLADPLVLALPRGGVLVGAAIAAQLAAPLDVVLVRKLGSPDEPELAIGAVAEGDPPEVVVNTKLVAELGVGKEFVQAQVARELANIEQRRLDYVSARTVWKVSGRTVIVVDDGVATGMTMQAALRGVRRRRPARLIAAAPVASRQAVAMLRAEADEVVFLQAPRRFGSVGSFYDSFGQVDDENVMQVLRAASVRVTGKS